MRPAQPPIGLHLTRVARAVSRAFDEQLASAGGSLPVWLVLVSLKANPRANQREIAEAMGITEATLTHHLNGMEGEGLITRRRDPANRRVHLLEITEEGNSVFGRLRTAAMSFDRQLRKGVSDDDVARLLGALGRLAANVGSELEGAPPWAGLVESRR